MVLRAGRSGGSALAQMSQYSSASGSWLGVSKAHAAVAGRTASGLSAICYLLVLGKSLQRTQARTGLLRPSLLRGALLAGQQSARLTPTAHTLQLRWSHVQEAFKLEQAAGQPAAEMNLEKCQLAGCWHST